MPRLKTHHRRKARAIKREVAKRVKIRADAWTLLRQIEVAIPTFTATLSKVFAGLIQALVQAQTFFPIHSRLPDSTQLDAEPFWDEWPEVIGD